MRATFMRSAAQPGSARGGVCSLFARIRFIVLFALLCAARSLYAGESFEPLVLQDAATQQGLTEFKSSHGRLDIEMEAVEDTDDVNGATMPLNPLLDTTPDEGGGGFAQFEYPRLAFHCKDATHEVTSFAGPLLRVQPGDLVRIHFTNDLVTQRTNLHFHGLEVSPYAENSDGTYGDFVRRPYVLPVAPGNTRTYQFRIPLDQPPGPYWYHAHVHGVAEEQVACGLSGALYVEGLVPAYVKAFTRRFAPLLNNPNTGISTPARKTLSAVAGALSQMPHALLVLKDFWTPGLGPINGPLEQSVNGKVTYSIAVDTNSTGTPYTIQYGPAAQIWEISNQSANLHYVLQFSGSNAGSLGFYVLGRDGMPDASSLQDLTPETTLIIPPAGRATVVVPTDSLDGGSVNVVAQTVDTVGDLYFQQGRGYTQRPTPWNLITLVPGLSGTSGAVPWSTIAEQINQLLSGVRTRVEAVPASQPVDATYVLAETPNPTAGLLPPEPAEFSLYRLAEPNKTFTKGAADAYEDYEPPIAHLMPGHPQRWIIQNASPEWHTFHLHQCHFFVDRFTTLLDAVHPEANQQPPQDNDGNPFYAVNEPPPAGSNKTVGQPYYSGEVDTVTIPNGMQVWLTLPMNEGPQIEGEFVMHCHILEHEDGGMMANVVAGPYDPGTESASAGAPHLAPGEVAAVRLEKPAPVEDSSGKEIDSDIFRRNDYSLVTFGYTTCQGACPQTLEKCVSALGKLKPGDGGRISPFFVSLDVERDDAGKLRDYAKEHHLTPAWRELLDTRLAVSHAFGARRIVLRRAAGSIYLTHSTTIYLIDRSMKIRAAFADEDTAETMSARMEKILNSQPAPPHSTTMDGRTDPRSARERQSRDWHPPA
jgi:FtsP/CotA-like multicopper oxidase with cupredoxin domain/cytochrome oxidase Cu insertion factor (SCO1/SenC/PrrC family)